MDCGHSEAMVHPFPSPKPATDKSEGKEYVQLVEQKDLDDSEATVHPALSPLPAADTVCTPEGEEYVEVNLAEGGGTLRALRMMVLAKNRGGIKLGKMIVHVDDIWKDFTRSITKKSD